ncbi:MAG TPA: TAXI family TRAP transporter solute-binding subunit [Planctomycetota bacterium]|nr:TAXI family TRAP transporter solute-binding subunit [Planctomycetota bacterium]
MKVGGSGVREGLGLWLGVAVITALGFVVAFRFVEPPPPRTLVLATGSASGAYHAYGERFREELARSGIELELRATAGSIENLALLAAGAVDVAFVQGGTVPAAALAAAAGGDAPYSGIASLYHEPLWIFLRADLAAQRLADLAGRRVELGPEGSGTRAVALSLLQANGIAADGVTPGELPAAQAADALLAGQADALFMVAGAKSETLARLLAEDGRALRLLDVRHAEAYVRNFHYLSALVLPEGALDLGRNLPDRDVHLLSPTAALCGRAGLHDAFPPLFIEAARRIFAHGGLFEAEGEFPSPRGVEAPLSKAAEHYFRDGPSFLYRVLPFGVAAVVDRLKILLLPLVTLLFPLFKLTPPLYRWRIRSKIYRWYKQIRAIDRRLAAAPAGGDLSPLVAELAAVQREIEAVRVPPSYMGEYYTLCAHLDWVLQRARR